MSNRQDTVFLLLLVLIGSIIPYATIAETQYTAKDENGFIVRQGIVDENEEFFAFDGLEYSIIGDHYGSGLVDSAGYVFGDRTKADIVGNIVNGEGTALEVNKYSSAVVHGDLFGDARNFDSTLEIHGNIYSVLPYGMPAVFATGDFGNSVGYKTQTTIFGDVQSAVCGVVASDGAHIKIVGSIDASWDGVHVGDYGDGITDGATCEVVGNIQAKEAGVVVFPSREVRAASVPWIDGVNLVQIIGNINAETDGIIAQGRVMIEGDVYGRHTGVRLGNDADVFVKGNVLSDLIETDYSDTEYYKENGEWCTYFGDGILSFVWDSDDLQALGRRIEVFGNVCSTGISVASEIGDVLIHGDVTSGYDHCVFVSNAFGTFPSTITIEGDVQGNNRNSAILIHPSNEDSIIIQGTVFAKGEQNALEVYDITGDDSRDATGLTLPQIVLKELSIENGNYIQGITHNELGEEVLSEKLSEEVAAAIWYIVDIIEPISGTIRVSGCKKQDDLLLVHEGDEITVCVSPKPGYMVANVNAGAKADVSCNGDDTFTVSVKRGGGLTISTEIYPVIDLPQTGDQSHIELAIAVLAVSLLVLAFMSYIGKREYS